MLTNLYNPQAFMAELTRRGQTEPVILHAPDPVSAPPKLKLQIQDACVLAHAYRQEAQSSRREDRSLLEAAYRSLLESQRIFENELALLAGSSHELSALWQQLGDLEIRLFELGDALCASRFSPSDNHRH